MSADSVRPDRPAEAASTKAVATDPGAPNSRASTAIDRPVDAGRASHAVRSWLRLLGSEVKLVLGRRRNQFGLGILSVVPIVMAIALKAAGGTASLQFGAITNGALIPIAALGIEVAFFLPMAVSLLAGDSIAGEAHSGTLRYLLVTPVGRVKLLSVKWVSLVIGAFIGVLVIAISGLVLGTILFGAGPTVTLSGTTISYLQGVGRLALVCLYVTGLMTAIASVGLFLSTLTDQPLAVTVGTMVVVILSWIAEAQSQLSWLHEYLITHWVTSFVGVLRDPIMAGPMWDGLGVAAGWTIVCLLGAWARFSTKDIAS